MLGGNIQRILRQILLGFRMFKICNSGMVIFMTDESKREINIGGKIIKMNHIIRKTLRFENIVVVLVYDQTLIPNNVFAFDQKGNPLWEVNDILKIKRPPGHVDIEKTENNTLFVFSSVDILYEIDVEKKKLIRKKYLR